MQAEDLRPAHSEKRDTTSSASPTFFEKFFSFLFGSNDPDREKKRLLKDIEHQLKSSKHRFYRPKTEEALPAMGKYFHELYSIAGPAQLLVDHADNSDVLKTMIIEHSFSDRQRELREHLSEESIKERSAKTSLQELEAEVKGKATEFLASFDTQKAKEINLSFNLLAVFLDVIHFDYYFLLKKFDSRLPEQDFKYLPHFDVIQAEYILEDLKDFLSMLYTVDPQANWKTVLAVLKEYRGTDVVSSSDWNKILRLLIEVRRSSIFELCIRHASKNPYFKVKASLPNTKVVEDYLAKLKTQTELFVQKLLKQDYEQTVGKYTKAVFGTTAVSRTKNYTEKNNAVFTQRMLGGFTHVAPVNYLYAFLVDYFKKDIRELVDLLIVRGRWSTPLMSQQLSESYHVLLQACDEVVALDEGLGDDGEVGNKIKNLIWKSDRDKSALKPLRQALKEVNDAAMSLLQQSARSLVVMGKSLKIVLDDYDKKNRELITNWKEIETVSGNSARSKIIEVYKKIYYFIQLIQLFVKKEPSK